jgi:hypothetical protein
MTAWIQDALPGMDHCPCPDCGSCFACGTECIAGCLSRDDPYEASEQLALYEADHPEVL